MTVSYASLGDDWDEEDEPMVMEFCFVVNDIFGDYSMSDFVAFEL